MKEFIKENFGIIYQVVIGVGLISIVSLIIATGGTADKATNGIFDKAVDVMEAELESDGE